MVGHNNWTAREKATHVLANPQEQAVDMPAWSQRVVIAQLEGPLEAVDSLAGPGSKATH